MRSRRVSPTGRCFGASSSKIKSGSPHRQPTTIHSIAEFMLEDFEPHVPPEAGEAILADLQRDLNNLGIFSVSAKPDDILMWS